MKHTPQTEHCQLNNSTSNAYNIKTTPKHLSEQPFPYEVDHYKFNKSSKNDTAALKKDSSIKLKKPSCTLVMYPVVPTENIKSTSNDVKKLTPSTLDESNIGDNIKLVMENQQKNVLLESELKMYHEHLKKYDKDAKEVMKKFTISLDEKSKVIKKCEEDLLLFNSRVCDLQLQLEESLKRTMQLECEVASTNPSLDRSRPSKSIATTTSFHESIDDITTNSLQLENKKLKETIQNLETKLAKRDLHIFNLKQVLNLETNKMKQLNDAQEEIMKLQRESIDKSNEISVLRDELKYAANMRSELISEYDEKIVKLKKLLAIREFLLKKERQS